MTPQQYYIILNNQQIGPFSLDDLKKSNIKRDTLIWTVGLKDWVKAEDLPIVCTIFDNVPPPAPNTQPAIPTPHVVVQVLNTPSATKPYFGYSLASRRERFFAFLVQTVIFLGLLLLVGEKIYVDEPYDFKTALIDSIMTGILSGLFYMLWSGNLGHRILGLVVISAKTGKKQRNFFLGFVREGLKNLFFPLVIPIAWLVLDEDRQTLYDKITNTYVVRKSKSSAILKNIFLAILSLILLIICFIFVLLYLDQNHIIKLFPK